MEDLRRAELVALTLDDIAYKPSGLLLAIRRSALHPPAGSQITDQPLAGRAVARVIRSRAEAAGLDGTRVTAHSLRAGHATAAALAGVPLDRIATQTRRKDLTVLVNRYIRPVEALATTSSTHLGL